MRFATLILKNIFRRRVRSFITILGISIGIATIISLGAIVGGAVFTVERMLKSGKADFSIIERGISDLTFSKIDEDIVDEIEELEFVKKAAGIAIGLVSLKDRPYFLVLGIEEEDLPLVGINIVSGTAFSQEEDEVIVGEIAAKELDVEAGERLSLGEEEFTVTGIFETGNPYFDKGAVIPLRKLQDMMKLEGYVMMIYVDLEEGTDIEDACWLIEEMFPDLVTVKSVAEFSEVDRSLEIMGSLSQGVSLLAILIGGLGVMNTMMMSVYERTREIGVLRALGWKRRRVLVMILGESIVLCLFSILLGTLLGFIAIKLLMLSPIIGGFFEPMWTADIFVNSFIVAFTVGLIGGLYPAYRACKLSPAEALRYE